MSLCAKAVSEMLPEKNLDLVSKNIYVLLLLVPSVWWKCWEGFEQIPCESYKIMLSQGSTLLWLVCGDETLGWAPTKDINQSHHIKKSISGRKL